MSDDIKTIKTIITRHRRTLAPVSVKALMGKYGAAKTADLLGVTASGLHTMIDRNSCLTPIERLAEKILLADGTASPSKARIWILKVTPTQMYNLKPVLDAFGVRVAFADDAD